MKQFLITILFITITGSYATEMRPPEVDLAISTLENGSGAVSSKSRYDAAMILLEHESPNIINALANIIKDTKSPSLTPLLVAISNYKKINPELFKILLKQASQIPKESQGAYREALLGCADGGHKSLEGILLKVQDNNIPSQERVAYIQLLDLFESKKETASVLYNLYTNNNESQKLKENAEKQFKKITGLNPNTSRNALKKWWNINKNKTENAWRNIAAEDLQGKIKTIEEQARKLESAFEIFLRQVWPKLKNEDQLNLVKNLLTEDPNSPPLSAIQILALERSSILLQDGHADEKLQQKIVALIDSGDTNVQFAAAELLPLIRFKGDALKISNSEAILNNEKLRAKVLTALRKRAPKELANLAILGLGSELAAAEILAELLKEQKLNQEQYEKLEKKLGTIPSNIPSLAALQILAKIKISETQIQSWLSENSDIRFNVADALASSGRHSELAALASNSWCEPFYIDALSNSIQLSSFNILIELYKSSSEKEKKAHLTDACIRYTGKIPLKIFSSLINQLHSKLQDEKNLTGISPQSELISKCISTRMLADIHARQSELILKKSVEFLRHANKGKDALAILQSRDKKLAEKFKDLEFQVALESSEFDAAAALFNTPKKWIAAYDFIKNGTDLEKEAAKLIRASILTRFKNQLDKSTLERLQEDEKNL